MIQLIKTITANQVLVINLCL